MKLRCAGFLLLAIAVMAAGCSRAAETSADDTAAYAPETVYSESAVSKAVISSVNAPEGTVLGAQPLPADQIRSLSTERQYTDAAKLGLKLYYDGAELPALADGKTFFLTFDENREDGCWGSGCLSANIDCTLAFSEDEISRGPEAIMSMGRPCKLYVLGDGVYSTSDIIFTTLPVITIDTESGKKIDFDDVKCTFSVFTPRNDKTAAFVASSAATIHIRGATSASLPKTSYRVSLYRDDYSDTNKLPLLGMRNDDDWILYASYSDEAKIRDAVAWNLWSKIGAYIAGDAPGTLALRYTEVIINGNYHGFYVFMERFDQKSAGVDDGDALFIVKDWNIPPSSELRALPPLTTFYGGVERKYPDPDDTGGYSGWELFADFVKAVYESDSQTFAKTIDRCANVNNMLDYWLFIQLIMGQDNTWKNTFYAVVDGYVHSFPWDMDVSFGLNWSGEVKNYLYQDTGSANWPIEFECGRRLIKNYPGAAEYVKKRWNELYQQGIITPTGIMEVAEGYWNELHKSGAFKRNLQRWPDTSCVENLDFFEKTVKRRVVYLSNYILSLVDAGK